MIDAQESREDLTAIYQFARARLLQIPAELRQRCSGTTGGEVERVAGELCRAALDDVASQIEQA